MEISVDWALDAIFTEYMITKIQPHYALRGASFLFLRRAAVFGSNKNALRSGVILPDKLMDGQRVKEVGYQAIIKQNNSTWPLHECSVPTFPSV